MTDNDKIWKWYVEQLNIVSRFFAKKFSHETIEADDVIGDILLDLLADIAKAEEIYQKGNLSAVFTLFKRKVNSMKGAEMGYKNDTDICYYHKIMKICNRYGIEPKTDNAYKIWALADNSTLTIHYISWLLTRNIPKKTNIDDMK